MLTLYFRLAAAAAAAAAALSMKAQSERGLANGVRECYSVL
jgi:hypothetical protein